MKFRDMWIHTTGTSFAGSVAARASEEDELIEGVGSEVGDGRCV